jgi:hypothetical protein
MYGFFKELNCYGEGKLKKIEAVLGVWVLKVAIAYADDEDALFLNNVGQGIKISYYDIKKFCFTTDSQGFTQIQ